MMNYIKLGFFVFSPRGLHPVPVFHACLSQPWPALACCVLGPGMLVFQPWHYGTEGTH